MDKPKNPIYCSDSKNDSLEIRFKTFFQNEQTEKLGLNIELIP